MTSNLKQSFSCQIPFDGFYESHHSVRINEADEFLFQFDSGEIEHPELYEVFWSGIDYLKVYQEYAKEYVKLVSSLLEVNFEFEELTSPREYNFITDRVFAKLSRADFRKLFLKVRVEALDNTVKETFTSRSGFHSFYSNKVSDWGPIDCWDHNQAGAVVAAALERTVSDDEIKDKCYEFIDQDEIEGWLIKAANAKAARALRINDYLRSRSER